MTDQKHTPNYTAKFRARGARLFREHRSDYSSDNAAYRAIASELGCCLSACGTGAGALRVMRASCPVRRARRR